MSDIARPHYAAGFELDGPYYPGHARHAQRLRAVLAKLLSWAKS